MVGFCHVCKIAPAETRTDISVHRIPKDKRTRANWVAFIGHEAGLNAGICSRHFKQSDFIYKIYGQRVRRFLKPGSCPLPRSQNTRKNVKLTGNTKNCTPLRAEIDTNLETDVTIKREIQTCIMDETIVNTEDSIDIQLKRETDDPLAITGDDTSLDETMININSIDIQRETDDPLATIEYNTNLETSQAQKGLIKERQVRFGTGGRPEVSQEIDADVAAIAPNLMATAPILFASNMNKDEVKRHNEGKNSEERMELAEDEQTIETTNTDLLYEEGKSEAANIKLLSEVCASSVKKVALDTVTIKGNTKDIKHKLCIDTEGDLKIQRLKNIIEQEEELAKFKLESEKRMATIKEAHLQDINQLEMRTILAKIHIDIMSKRKGVSLDEKRMRMLQIFYDKKEFFTLKELEKIAPKEKNIVVQAVKDVLQGLVDDGLVRSEKIGTSIYFWRFPGENITATERRIAETNKKLVETEFKVEKLRKEIQKEKELKNDTEEKRKLLEEVEQLRKEEQEIKKQIAKFSDVDPEVITEMDEKAQKYKDVTNIWTDNVFAIQSWCKNKFSVSEQDLNKMFNIPEDLDYK
ncbi:hypothetical protein DBV15_06458 [Temnothorax longispinosus]|uniref:THAP-type domain-containing protein n=2 Tax=Temnothorax longispinosus TaxID=300112 RepID=A0A4S2KUI0_9HYME|nr:hypothetical protein DBV15_06458 [Temnothorax longispinosus]